MLGNFSKDVIEGFINSIQTAEIAVLVVKGISPTYVASHGLSIDKASEKFAHTIHDAWGVGDASRNDGILIFLSAEDRAIFISTGEGNI